MNAFTAADSHAPLFAPIITNESNNEYFSILQMTTAASTTIPLMIHRAFDVRRVHNSDSEIRLSMDVPGTQKEDLAVCLQRRQSDGNKPDSSSVNIRGSFNNGESFFSKTLELPSSRALDLANVKAKLTNGVLEIIAPKMTNQQSAAEGGGDHNANITVM